MHSLNLIRRVAYSIATLALAFTAYAGIGVPSASAATGMMLNVSCESGGIGGVPHFVCDGYLTGGVYPYSYQWQALGNAVIKGGSDTETAGGVCTGKTYAAVRLTVHDSLGNTVTKDKSFYCNPGYWP